MYLTTNQYDSLYQFADDTVFNSYRCRLLIRNDVAKAWLAKTACEGLLTECVGFSKLDNAVAIESIKTRVYDYVTKANKVTKGGEPTFIISSIILAALLSWLIQKLLNHIFPNV